MRKGVVGSLEPGNCIAERGQLRVRGRSGGGGRGNGTGTAHFGAQGVELFLQPEALSGGNLELSLALNEGSG